MEKPTNKTCCIYCRVSSTDGRQNCDRQVADLTDYAAKNGLQLAHEPFTEQISGAKSNSERLVLNECLDYCFSNSVDVLLISELSRLGRSIWEVLENVHRAINGGLDIHFQKECFNIFTADGKVNPLAAITISVLGTCAQIERENIAFRLNSGRAKYIADGGKLGRRAGSVKSEESMLEQYPEAVSLLRRGKSVRDTAARCHCSKTTVMKLRKIIYPN